MNPSTELPFRSVRALMCLSAALFLAADLSADQTESSTTSTPPPATTAAGEEVNVGTSTLGAAPGGSASGLGAVLAGEPGAQAQLAPNQNGTAFAVINLAGQANLSRVAIDIAPAKGRLVMVGMNERGEQVDLSDPQNLSKLIGDRQLDGTETSLSFDVSKLTVKAVMIYWVPETPGQELVIAKAGIFTRETFVPEATPPAVPAAVPEPVVPSPAVIETMTTSLAAGAPAAAIKAAAAAANGNAPTPVTTSSLPAVILPSSIPVSL